MPLVEKIGHLAAVVLFALPGLALVQLLPATRSLDTPSRLGYSYLLGVAWVAGGLYALSHLFQVPMRPPAIAVVAAVPVLAWLVLVAGRGAPATAALAERPKPHPLGRLEIAVALVALAVFCGALLEVVSMPLRDWDGRMTWATEARYMRAEGTVSPTVLTEPGWFLTVPWYPPLLPVAQVAVLEITAANDDQHVFRGLYALFFPAWLLILYGTARHWVSPTAASLTTLVAALLPWATVVAMTGGSGLVLNGAVASAYSDLPLACFFGAGLVLLLRAAPSISAGLGAGLLLAAAALAKNEGAPLAVWALAVIAFAVALPRGVGWLRRLRASSPALAIAAAGIGAGCWLLHSWQAGVAGRFSEYRQIYQFDHLWPNLVTRAPQLATAMTHQMLSPSQWGLFWIALPLVLVAGRRGLLKGPGWPLGLAALGPVALGWGAYSAAVDPQSMVATTWSRLLLQASLPVLLLFALALDELLRAPSQWAAAERQGQIVPGDGAGPTSVIS